MAGIAGSCAVRDEALTQSFHLAQRKHRCVRVQHCMCVCIYVHQWWQPDHYEAICRPFQSVKHVTFVNLQVRTYSILCAQCVHECIMMCGCKSMFGVFVFIRVCSHVQMGLCMCESICVSVCVPLISGRQCQLTGGICSHLPCI